jgi:hypothetical protein
MSFSGVNKKKMTNISAVTVLTTPFFKLFSTYFRNNLFHKQEMSSSSRPPILDAPMAVSQVTVTESKEKETQTVHTAPVRSSNNVKSNNNNNDAKSKKPQLKRKSMNLSQRNEQKDYIMAKLLQQQHQQQEQVKQVVQHKSYRFNEASWKDVSPAEGTSVLFSIYCKQMFGEIEAKLGKWVDGAFVSGVSQADFDRILNMLSSYQGWTNLEDSKKWHNIIDYILLDNIRVSKTYQGNQFLRKTLMDNLTLRCPERPYNVRISLKQENPCELQLPKDPTLVRVKKRRSFEHKKTWRFDLSYVWSGCDEQDAQSRPPVCEVECEYVGDKNQVITETKYYASSMLEKMMDLLGRETPLHLEIMHSTFPSPHDLK